MLNEKAQGSFAELQFAARATEGGGVVSMPFNDTAPYDFVVDVSGKLYRVQVKSSFREDTSYVSIQHGKSKRGRGVPEIAWDVLAAYDGYRSVWYLVAAKELRGKTSYSFKDQHREAWEDFGLTVSVLPGLRRECVPAPTASLCIMGEGTKRCPTCRNYKRVSEFSINRTRPGGRQSQCKSCRSFQKSQRRKVG